MIDAELVARVVFAHEYEKLAHTCRIVERLTSGYLGATEDELDAIVQIAWLHDVVEDTHLELEDLKMLGFPGIVIAAVDMLTRTHPYDYDEYVQRLVKAQGKVGTFARAVKYADASDNLDRCMRSIGVPRYAKLAEERYRPLLRLLTMYGGVTRVNEVLR